MPRAVATLALVLCATAASARSAEQEVVVTYDVRARRDGAIEVEVTTAKAAPGGLLFDDGRGADAEEAALLEAGRWRPVAVEGDLLKAEPCRRGACRVRYRYRLP